jgi:hypothetical protein
MSFLTMLKGLLGFGPKSVSLAPGDRLLPCDDCRQDFVFDVGEQRFFKEKGFTDPKRCPKCRRKVRSRMRRRGRRGRGGGEGGGSNGNAPESNRHESRGDNRGDNRRDGGGRGHPRGRRHSVIDGDSPYADER